MVAREAINTSDNVGTPLVQGQDILSTFVPDVQDILSLRVLFDKQFFKLFFVGIALSGTLTLCTVGIQRYHTADKTDWNSLYNAGRSQVWVHNYDDAQKCYEAALELGYIDRAERSYIYGELGRLAAKKGDMQSAREFWLKEGEYSQFGFGFVTILISSIILFAIAVATVLIHKKDREKTAIGWIQPATVCIATYAISAGIHAMAPNVPWLVLTLVGGAMTFAVLVLSAACNGSSHPQFVTPSRD